MIRLGVVFNIMIRVKLIVMVLNIMIRVKLVDVVTIIIVDMALFIMKNVFGHYCCCLIIYTVIVAFFIIQCTRLGFRNLCVTRFGPAHLTCTARACEMCRSGIVPFWTASGWPIECAVYDGPGVLRQNFGGITLLFSTAPTRACRWRAAGLCCQNFA